MSFRPVFVLSLLVLACGSPKATETTPADVADATVDVADVEDIQDIQGTDAVADIVATYTVPQACVDGGWSGHAFATGPYGTHRHDLAENFQMPMADGSTWDMQEHWLGCESYLFVPDLLPVSDQDPTSIWSNAKDLATLVKKSPRNVHYFFVSQRSSAEAQTSIDDMQARVDALLATLSEGDAMFWKEHLHVVAQRAQDLDAWPGQVLLGHGQIGFGIDRAQRIRGFGMLADVTRPIPGADASKIWPYKSNLVYVANEAVAFNGEQLRADARDGEDALVVPVYQGEVLAGFAETDVTLTTADKLAGYDTLEVDVEMRCPDADAPEPGNNNCGAWDYIAWLAVKDDAGKSIEIARFITSYHRETHWTVDATPMLVYLRKGGTQHFHWEFAPTWNTQPTSTYLSLRFSNRKKGMQPTSVTKLWDGGGFNSQYDTLHPDQKVAIPKTAKKVELWALITGHGSDSGTQCAEFCNHQHVFSVGGKTFTKAHPEAGTQSKCMLNMDKGMVPNQGGSWWYGRGGWCPGMQVDPWVADLAGAMTDTTATLTYHGQLGGKTPPDGGANIDGAVWLVVYE
jgi:hypothetical protein